MDNESEEDEENHTNTSIQDIDCRGLVHEVILESIEKKADQNLRKSKLQ